MAKGSRAHRVGDMLFVVLGIAVGLAVALGPLSFLAAPFDALAEFLVGVTDSAVDATLGRVAAETGHATELVEVLSVVLSTATPGLVALGLVLTSQAAESVRRAVAYGVLVFSLVGFFHLPLGSALLLLVLAALFAAVSGALKGGLVTLPLVALATVLAVRHGVTIWTWESESVAQGAGALAALAGDPAGVVPWKVALTVVGIAPFAWAAVAAIRGK